MVNPQPGTFLLNFGTVNGCSWNVAADLYQDINTASPFGAITSNSGDALMFTDTITTVSPYSIIDDFIAYPNGPFAFNITNGTQLFPSSASGCCDDIYGAYFNTGGPGAYSIVYSQSTGMQPWWGETVELKGVTACGTPTASPTPTP